MTGTHWQQWEIDELLKIKNGASVEDIARVLPHRGVQGVRTKAQTLGLMPKAKHWNEEEDRILRENYPSKSYPEIQKLLPRWTEKAVKARACKIGLTQGGFNHPCKWTAEEDEIIRQNYRVMRYAEMASLLPGRNIKAIKSRVAKLGLLKLWTEEEQQIVKDGYGTISKEGLMKRLPYRTWSAISHQAMLLGVTQEPNKPWEEWEIDILNTHYGVIPNKELCKMLPDRTPEKLRSKAHDLGITDNISWSEEEKAIVRKWYGKISRAGIAKMLPGRPVGGIGAMADKLGLTTKQECPASPWTEAEEQIMLANYETLGPSGVQELLPDRTLSGIMSKSSGLGLCYRPFWEEWEDQVIKDNYGLMPCGAMSEMLPRRTAIAIRQRAYYGLGLKTEVNWWTKEEDEILCANYGALKMPQLKELFPDRTKASITKRANILGLQEQGYPQWTEDQDEVLRQHYRSMTVEQLLDLLPERSGYSIYNRARNLGLQQQYIYSADQNFFEKPNVLNSYWAGFLAADGCITGKQTVCIDLSPVDRDHIEKFVADTKFTGHIREAEYPGMLYGKPKMCKHCSISISCAPLWPLHLEQNFNITRKKSLTLQPPQGLTHKQAIAFIAGYFDGDGCVMFVEKGNAFWLSMSFVGTMAMMQWIQDHCDRIAPATSGRQGSKANKKGNIATYGIAGKRAEILITEILKLKIPRLTRKWDSRMRKFVEWKKLGHFQPSLLCPEYSKPA